ASEQQISLAKSTIFFSPNTPSNLGQQICHILGMPRLIILGSISVSLPFGDAQSVRHCCTLRRRL
ncbi:PREDICTED: PRUPE_7G008600, partial [Prunus dulcis]